MDRACTDRARMDRLSWRAAAARLALVLCGPVVLAIPSCMPKAPEGLDSPIAQERMEAAVEAAERQDVSAVPSLIVMLESDDPAVRLVGINSLEAITTQRLGYDATADEADRQEALERWRQWAEEHVPKEGRTMSAGDVGRPPQVRGGMGGGTR
jgi:hypothetical protein